MGLTTSYWLLLCISLSCAFAQLFVPHKKSVHLFFAIFCSSIAMMSAQQLSQNTSPNLFFLFGLGACATCNGYWLVARCLFRQENPVGSIHMFFAVSVAVLLVVKKCLGQLDEIVIANVAATTALSAFVGETLVLISSSMMILTIFEGIRNWSELQGTEKKQRKLFLLTILGSTLTASIWGGAAETAGLGPDIKTMLIPFAACSVIITTQTLILWRFSNTEACLSDNAVVNEDVERQETASDIHIEIAQQIKHLLLEQKLYLQSNLKVSDVARSLDVSEYLISKAVRLHFEGKNFNQLINQLRVQHAKQLLEDPASSQWTVMIVGLESGFASVGPFSRAFKDITGETPGRYRKNLAERTETC